MHGSGSVFNTKNLGVKHVDALTLGRIFVVNPQIAITKIPEASRPSILGLYSLVHEVRYVTVSGYRSLPTLNLWDTIGKKPQRVEGRHYR